MKECRIDILSKRLTPINTPFKLAMIRSADTGSLRVCSSPCWARGRGENAVLVVADEPDVAWRSFGPSIRGHALHDNRG